MKAGLDYTGNSVVMLCHDGQGNLLMHKRSQACRDEQGKWDCGGGKLEFGENLRDAILRELKEEYGCDGVIDLQLPSYSINRFRGDQPTHWVATPFIIRVDPTQVKLNEPESMEEIGWHKVSAMPQPYHPGFDLILEQHAETIKKFFN